MDLSGKRVVVLGGTSGIGLAVARAAAAQGAALTVASRRQARVEAAVAALPSGAEGRAVDLADPGAVEAFFAEVGGFDHLVYTAGETLALGPIGEADLAEARRFFDTRYWGAYAAAKFAHPRLRPGGSITFTSGGAGRRPRSGWSLGASVCSAMEGLTRALAVELAPVRVNIVAPGLVRTELWDGMSDDARQGMYDKAAGALPVGHVGEADEVAQAYLYLMGQSYGTGQVVVVDGGGSLV